MTHPMDRTAFITAFNSTILEKHAFIGSLLSFGARMGARVAGKKAASTGLKGFGKDVLYDAGVSLPAAAAITAMTPKKPQQY